jgi:hypothetical protein
MQRALKSALDKLQGMQTSGNGFPWFKGGNDDQYITQYIFSGIGRLRKLKAVPADLQVSLDKMARQGIVFLDKEIKSDFEKRDKQECACVTCGIDVDPVEGVVRLQNVQRLLAEGLFLSKQARDREDNLIFVRERLLRSEVDVAGLLYLYRRVHAGQAVADDETNPLCTILRLSGIVRGVVRTAGQRSRFSCSPRRDERR